MRPQQSNAEDYRTELSLFELIKIFWQQKWLILISTLVCLGISTTYLFFAKPIYEEKASVVSPKLSDISMLNVGQSYSSKATIKDFTTDEIYQIYIDALLSDALKSEFFKQFYLPSLTRKQRDSMHKDTLYADYLKTLQIREVSRSKPFKYTVIANSEEPSQAREWVKQYIYLAEKNAAIELSSSINAQNKTLTQNIRYEIDKIRDVSKKLRLDRISQLKDALVIAKATNIQNPSMSGSQNTLDTVPMIYMRGTNAIEAEIKVLNTRKTDDAFSANLRMLENEYNFYATKKVPIESIKMYRLDGTFIFPEAKIAPKKRLILIFGLLIGLICGFALAIIRNELAKRFSVTLNATTLNDQKVM